MLVTQTEIIESVTVDSHLSVNNITDDTIQKSELYLSSTFLGDTFYLSLETDKTGTGTFGDANYQSLYDKYLKRLISEYVVFMSMDEIVLRLANNGLKNEGELKALKYAKESLRDEVERSKAMIDSYLKNNKINFPLYKENTTAAAVTSTAKKKSRFGFIAEENLRETRNEETRWFPI
jgi:hypothetical protein